jgi:hypothetical protein
MSRRAYRRTLKTGKVVSVKASFTGSPNRAPGKFTKAEIEGARNALQRHVMVTLGGHLGPALKSVRASDADAIKYLTTKRAGGKFDLKEYI